MITKQMILSIKQSFLTLSIALSFILIPSWTWSVPTPSSSHSCRVLINLTDSQYKPLFIDLKLSASPKIKMYKGEYGMANQEGLYRIQLRPFSKSHKTTKAKNTRSWTDIYISPFNQAIRESKNVLVHFPNIIDLEYEDEWTSHGMDETQETQITGIFNHYLSVYSSANGYAGGAHGFDEQDHFTLDLNRFTKNTLDLASSKVPLSLFFAQSTLKKMEQKLRDEPLENPPQWDAQDHFTLAYHQSKKTQLKSQVELQASLRYFCCSWAENHNLHTAHFKLNLPSSTHQMSKDWKKTSLKSALPNQEGWFKNECGQFRLSSTGIETQVGQSKHHIRIDEIKSLVGVSWVPSQFKSIDLSARPLDQEGHRKALRKGRLLLKKKDKQALQSFEKAVKLWPEHALSHSELGWTYFKFDRLQEAEKSLQTALNLSKSDKEKGMIYYNLGRVAEKQEAFQKAIERYTQSLHHRPHKGVQKRLDRLKSK